MTEHPEQDKLCAEAVTMNTVYRQVYIPGRNL